MSEVSTKEAETGHGDLGQVDDRSLPLARTAVRAELGAGPLWPSDFCTESQSLDIDVYGLTKCFGAGNAHEARLCDYCFLSKAQLKSNNEMSIDSAEQIVRWITCDDEPNVGTISLLGGELALHPEVKELIARFYPLGQSLHVVTNGSEEFQALLEDSNVASMLRGDERHGPTALVAVSLDAITDKVNDRHRGQGAARNAKETIVQLREKGINFRINATVTNDAVPGLGDLFDFANDSGAQSLLVHFPSKVGSGQSLRIISRSTTGEYIGTKKNDVPSRADWYSHVIIPIEKYNRQQRRAGSSFRVRTELGYTGIHYDSEREMRCDMRARRSSLQFVPQVGPNNPDIPVVACGLNMATANTNSAYILRDSLLYERAGTSELQRARRALVRRCPLAPDKRLESLGCIYRRLEDESIPSERLTYDIPSGG